MARRLAFIGTWEVVNCEYVKGTCGTYDKYIKCMEGVRFRLEENGDVTWIVPEDLKSVPLFSCETYTLHYQGPVGVILRFGTYAGHVFEFTHDRGIPKQHVILTCEGLCTLHCIRVNDDIPDVNHSNATFMLLPALEDGYFSDITITSSNNKQFKVHSAILELQGHDIDWHSDPPPFSNIPEDVLGTILHFLYSECLPDSLTEETARQVIAIASPHVFLTKLVNNCQLYLKNMALKQQIIRLVNDMHSYMNQIIDRFHHPKNSSSSESIISNPSTLCFVVKQSIRDAAVAGVKLLLLCDLFTKRKNELSRNERHEIIRYAKSRLPIFLNQLMRFLQALKNTFSSMSPAQRTEIAAFLVPEIEIIMDTICMLIVHVENALQQIIQGLFTPDVTKSKTNVGDMLSKTLRNLLHIRELTKLNSFHEHITVSLSLIVHKRENFNQMSSSQKVRSIIRNLEELIEELPILLIKLQETASVFEEKLEWRDFKFCFKVGTSKVSYTLHKLYLHTDSLQDVMLQVCELVQRDAFTQTLQSLGLLNAATSTSHTNDPTKMPKSPSYSSPKHHSCKLNLVESLCSPPDASNSLLSKLCLQLLNSEKKADMEFEVVGSNFGLEQTEEATPVEERHIIKSHRVIVAARCDWFRRALLSGMRESIDKKIVIHDTSPYLFRILLEYLYSGRLIQDSLATEQLVEMLLLSDRYEMDALKQTCEYALVSSIDSESVLYFLSMADQYNARILRSRSLSFISQHPELTESEEFFELSISLQAEIFECVLMQPGCSSSVSNSSLRCSSPGVNDRKNGVETAELDVNRCNDSSLEDLHLEQNSTQMDTCITQLRDIVGDVVPRETLVQVILAADFDMRRAVNYYYARNNGDE